MDWLQKLKSKAVYKAAVKTLEMLKRNLKNGLVVETGIRNCF